MKHPRVWAFYSTEIVLPSELYPKRGSTITAATWEDPSGRAEWGAFQVISAVDEVGVGTWSLSPHRTTSEALSILHEGRVAQFKSVGYKNAFGTQTVSKLGITFKDFVQLLFDRKCMGPFWHTNATFVRDLTEWLNGIDSSLVGKIGIDSLATLSIKRARLEAELAELEYTANTPLFGAYS